MTGTGYASADYGLWGAQSIAFFFFIMFIGGCAGSTSCGIKIFRFQVLYAEVRERLAKVLYPHGVFVKRFNGRPLDARVPLAVTTFVFLYFAAFAVLSIALRLTGLDLITAISGAGSAISNVGPGSGRDRPGRHLPDAARQREMAVVGRHAARPAGTVHRAGAVPAALLEKLTAAQCVVSNSDGAKL
jgi:Trk-type K+ transport system membrane component